MERHDARAARSLSEPDEELDRLAGVVIEAAVEVHRLLGPGYLEAVSEESLSLELSIRGIPYHRQVPIEVNYKGSSVGSYRLDLLVGGRLVVEVKAVEGLLPIHGAQLRSYLKTTRRILGLLINFNVPTLRTGVRRVILSNPNQ